MFFFFFSSRGLRFFFFFFFFNDTATTEIYTLSLHDALPISARFTTACCVATPGEPGRDSSAAAGWPKVTKPAASQRSEEHTSELQSRLHLVCRLLLEKKKNNTIPQSPAAIPIDACPEPRR